MTVVSSVERMMPLRVWRVPRCSIAAPLFTLAVVAMLLGAASVPHVHIGPEQGFYNQEHDLSYLATFGGVAPPSEAPTLIVGVVVVLPGGVIAVAPVVSAPRRHTDSRAPPVR